MLQMMRANRIQVAVRVLGRLFCFFFFQAEDGIRDLIVTGVQTCALPISPLGSRRRDPGDRARHLRRYPAGQSRGHVRRLRGEPQHGGRREGERDGHSPHRIRAPRAVTATMLLRRPKPSPTPGAAGSATHCSPSTTTADWWCPRGNSTVLAHTPPPPTRTNGDAFRSHWLKVPATATCFAAGAYRPNRTYSLSRPASRACP